MLLQPYLNFDGRCAEAFRFYHELLGGELQILTFADAPPGMPVPKGFEHRVLHARLAVGDAVLLASDAPPDRYRKPQGLYVSLSVKDPIEAERIYDALAKGGTVEMPLQETFWSPRFGMVTDRFGTPWMVNCEPAA